MNTFKTNILIITFTMGLMSLHGMAQDAVPLLTKRCNGIRPNEFITKYVVNSPQFREDGKSWNLADADISSEPIRQEFFEYSSKGDITSVEQGTMQRFREVGDSVYYLGFENNFIRICYDKPELRLMFPMENGNHVEGVFHGKGTYCDKFFIHTFGTYRTEAESVGLLVTENGDTINNTLLIHTKRLVSNVYCPIDRVLTQQNFTFDNFPADSIMERQRNDTTITREDLYFLYVPGFRYPVVENRCITIGGHKNSVCLYTSIDGQTGMEIDEANKEWQNLAKDSRKSNGSTQPSLHYQTMQDKNGRQMTIQYCCNYDGRLSFLLSDTMGRVLISKTNDVYNGETANATIDYSSLRPGHYVLYICTKTEKFAEKFTIE